MHSPFHSPFYFSCHGTSLHFIHPCRLCARCRALGNDLLKFLRFRYRLPSSTSPCGPGSSHYRQQAHHPLSRSLSFFPPLIDLHIAYLSRIKPSRLASQRQAMKFNKSSSHSTSFRLVFACFRLKLLSPVTASFRRSGRSGIAALVLFSFLLPEPKLLLGPHRSSSFQLCH